MKRVDFEFQTADGLELTGWAQLPETSHKARICLVHGLREHSGRYGLLTERLIAAGYALAGFDLRGHGRSQGPRGHAPGIAALMDDISRFLAKCAAELPGAPVLLYGHSMGGTLVLNYVLRELPQLAGTIATAPFLEPGFKPPAWKLLLGKAMDRLRPTLSLPSGIDPNCLSHDAEVVRAYRQDPLVHDRLSARLGMTLLQAGAWALEHASEFSIPLLLMQGSADPIVSAEACREFAAGVGARCDFKLWDGFYHEIHNESGKEAVYDYLLKWLSARTAGAENESREGR